MLTSIIKNTTSTVAAGSAGITAVSLAGVPGLSAIGCTTGLAALGAGSMVLGVGAVALIGAGVFTGVRRLWSEIADNI